jgi:hypothetical protein
MHECVLLNMFCSICLIAIIVLRLLYVFKKNELKKTKMSDVVLRQKQGVIIIIIITIIIIIITIIITIIICSL